MFEISDLIFHFFTGIAIILVLGKIMPGIFYGSSYGAQESEEDFATLVKMQEDKLRLEKQIEEETSKRKSLQG